MRNLIKLSFICLLALLVVGIGQAKDVGGPIAVDTVWDQIDNPFHVVRSVLVLEDVTLTIMPGVIVKFEPDLAFQVDGQLIAQGTDSEKIIFTSNEMGPAPGDWGYIYFSDTSVDAGFDEFENYVGGSIMQYCVVEYSGGTGASGAVWMKDSSPYIDQCIIRNNAKSGICVAGFGAEPKINENRIEKNSSGGICLSGEGPTATITGNNITQNSASDGGGISVPYYSTATITGNNISQNSASGKGGGIYVYSGSTATITNNNIFQNTAREGGGIYASAYWGASDSTVTITGNSIVGNVISEWKGAAINFYDNTSGLINGNLIANNKASGEGNTNTVFIYSIPSSFTENSLLGDDTEFTIYFYLPHGYTMDATNNFWGTVDSFEISLRIYDWFVDPSKGIVEFIPFLTEPDVDTPPGPPKGLAWVAGAQPDEIDLNWQPNPESDLAGYKVYYDFDVPGYPYDGTGLVEGDSPINVGNVTSFTLSGLVSGMTYYLALTAYDADGNESWYSKELAITLGENNPPNTPTNIEPPNGAEDISLTPTLISSDFSDPDPDDVHQASQWQIADMLGDFSEPVFDSGTDTENLTSIAVPKGTLRYEAVYYWRVRHQDDDGAWSNFSNPTKFQTTPRLLGDVSGNGIISAYDASLILQFVVGLINQFPADMMMSPPCVTPRDYKVSVPRMSVALGKRIEAPIFINDATGLRAGAFILRYDASVLKPVKVTASPTLSGCYWESNLMLGSSASSLAKSSEIRIAFAGANPTEGEGALFYVEFETLPRTDGRRSSLILETVQLSESKDIARENGWVEILPSKTVLLPNYPNPFNPETWIPFKLEKNVSVVIRIYSAKGELVRTITLGNNPAGVYTTKAKAAYWDGTDSLGENVASGVYFYTLQAGEFRATQKMVIMK